MNRQELRNLVFENTRRTDKTTETNNAINTAVRKISSEHLWTDLETEGITSFTIGVNSVALASTARRISEIRVMDGLSSYCLKIRTKRWISCRYPDPTAYSNGKPCYGYLQGTILFVVPPPDQAYQIRYTYYPIHPDLVNETDELQILQATEAVVAYATYRVFKSIERHEDAAPWLTEYALQLRDAKNLDHSSVEIVRSHPRISAASVDGDYWLDPFVRQPPGELGSY